MKQSVHQYDGIDPNQRVKESNELLNAQPVMNWHARKFFDICAAYIRVEEDAGKLTAVIPKRALYEYFNLDSKSSGNKFTKLKKKLYESMQNAVFEFGTGSKSSFGNVYINIEYGNSRTKDVTVDLNPAMRRYIYSLKANYTNITLLELAHLSEEASFLYHQVVRSYSQYEQYHGSGKRTEAQLKELQNPYFSLEELFAMVNADSNSIRPYDFVSRNIQKAVDNITEHTVYNVELERVLKGRRIVGVRLRISMKGNKIYSASDNFGIDVDDGSEGAKLSSSLENPYVKLLAKAELIAATDLVDQKIRSGLASEVYPLYLEIETYGSGFKSVRQHISYVRAKKEDPEKKGNIVKYLHKSAEQQAMRLKNDALRTGKNDERFSNI